VQGDVLGADDNAFWPLGVATSVEDLHRARVGRSGSQVHKSLSIAASAAASTSGRALQIAIDLA
jgi:hypothetical protein